MANLNQFGEILQLLFGQVANQLAKQSGFRRRASKLNGANLLSALICGFSADANASRSLLGAFGGCSKQAIDQALTPECAEFLYQILLWLVQQSVDNQCSAKPLLAQFNGVYVLDSSTVKLPAALADKWPGCGGNYGGAAALKIHLGLDLVGGGLLGPDLTNGKVHDRSGPHQDLVLPQGSLRLADLGYFKLKRLQELAAKDAYYITKIPAHLGFYREGSQKYESIASWLAAQKAEVGDLELQVRLGRKEKVECRLVAHRLDEAQIAQRQARLKEEARRREQAISPEQQALSQWSVYVTNVEAEKLTAGQVATVYAMRWQIELMFKLWKSEGGELEQWQSQKPWAILCEIYAKLISMVLVHWEVLVSGWQNEKLSLWKAVRVGRAYLVVLISMAQAGAKSGQASIMARLHKQLGACKLDSHGQQPSSYQKLARAARTPARLRAGAN